MNNTAYPTQPAPSVEEESIDIGQYWRVIKRHKFGIFSITLIAVIIGVLAALSATPVYKTATKLIADPIQPKVNANEQYISSALVFLFYETQYEIIGSLNIAKKAVDKLKLVERYKKEQKNKPAEGSNSFIQTWLSGSSEQEVAPEPTDEILRSMIATGIQARLNIEGGKQSQIITISYEDEDPQLAADITNAIAEAYVEFGLESRLSGAKQTSTWLEEQLQDLKNKLNDSENALQNFQRKQGMVDTNQQERLSGTRLSALTTELTRAQTKRSEIDIRHKQIISKHQRGDYASLSPLLNNEGVRQLEQETTKLSRSVQDLSERYGEKHPRIIAARADLREANRNLKIEINKIVDSVRKEQQAARDHEKKLSSLIYKEKKDLSALKGSSFELTRLERDVLNNQKLYEAFLGRSQEANLSEQYDVSSIHVIDVAQVPVAPFKPNRPRFIIIALVLGLFMGTLFAFLREHLDNTFKSTEELENKLSLPALGIIPEIKNAQGATSPQTQVFSAPGSPFAENINHIRTGLLFSNVDNPPQTILITSAISAEGKSTLAHNLAASFSQLENTLLLEIDLRKPSTARYLNIKKVPGITDQALCKESILKEAITRIGDENSKLYVMPAGSVTPNPLELLSSEYFKTLLEKLKKTFTYIVLDAPPVLAVSDAIIAGQLVDSVIVAAKAESTKIQMTQETISRLRKANVRITGTVLTQADAKRIGEYGGHYYHYYDESYASQGKKI